jgi:rRNA processing protein Gar1
MVPYFNAPIYLDKNSKIGKVDEVNSVMNKAEAFAVVSLSGYDFQRCP